MDVISLLNTFVCIADSGSISSAARRLRLSVPMASRHLRALEGDLGVPLVRRTTRRMDLTEAGVELLRRARRLLRELDETRQAMRPGNMATGRLVVSAPVSFGLSHIAPLVPKLLAEHPHLSLDIRFDDRPVDLLSEGVDLALRLGLAPPNSPFIVSRRLVTYERLVCATPSVVKKRGPVKGVECLATLPCIVLGAATRWQFETLEGPKSVDVEGRFRSNNILATREACLAGLGFAQLPRWLIVDDLKAGRLVHVLEGAVLPLLHLLGLVHTDTRHSNALRLVQDFFAAEVPPRLRRAPGAIADRRSGVQRLGVSAGRPPKRSGRQ